MRIAVRFSLVFFGALFVVLVGQATWGVYADWRAYRRDLHRDHRLIGTALGEALGRVWTEQGREAAEEILRDVRLGKVRARLVDRKPKPGAQPLTEEEVRQRFRRDELVTRVAVRTTGHERLAWIELSEPVPTPSYFLARNVRPAILTTLISALLYGGLAAFLGVRAIARPVQRLVARTRRIREGDLSEDPTLLESRDELAELGAELNAMCRRLAEAGTRAASAEAQAVLEKARADQAVEQLRHADRLSSVGRLAASLVHELGTPLSIVTGRAQMLARGRVEPDRAAEVGKIIADEGARVADMIRQLLDFSRRQKASEGPFDLEERLLAWRAVLEPLAKRSSVVLDLDLPGDEEGAAPLRRALGDPALIQQVVTNLVVNAIHAMPDGGRVRIKVRDPGPEDDEDPGFLELSVEDDGVGMPDAVLARAFEPFFTTKDPGKGTGLGLAVVQGIVDDQGGGIDIDSAPGEGTRVRVTLRAAP